MKCINCKVDVSPKFVAAISQNRCPACGKDLMSINTYKKIKTVKNQIKELGFDEGQLIGIAAALATKFTLVPKELGLEEDENGEEISISIEEDSLDRSMKFPIGKRNDDDDNDDLYVSPEEEKEILMEMNRAPTEYRGVSSKEVDMSDHIEPELASAIISIDPIGPVQELPGAGVHRQAALLAKVEQSKNSSNAPNFKRVTY